MTPGSRRPLAWTSGAARGGFVMRFPALIGILVVGLLFVGLGLSRFARQGIYERGPTTLHIDDVDVHTLQAYPWITITHAHLCQRPDGVRIVDGERHAYAALISAQQVRDCRLGVIADCCASPVIARIPDGKRVLHGGTSDEAMNVTGLLREPSSDEAGVLARGQVLMVLDERPQPERGAYALMLGGVVLVLMGACGLVWRMRVRG